MNKVIFHQHGDLLRCGSCNAKMMPEQKEAHAWLRHGALKAPIFTKKLKRKRK